jgi:hypothetical protein
MAIKLSSFPWEVIDEYNLPELAHDGRVNIKIQKCMYGLNELLQQRLSLNGYHPTKHTHGLWKNKTRPVCFSLVMDDFGIK